MSGAQPPVRVVVADDEEMVRTALRPILGAEDGIEVVGEAATGAEAVSVVRALRPDVVLMDVRMPETDGVRATEQILATLEDPPRIVVVTTFENDAYVYDALRAGAAGFLLKRSAAEELVQAVRLVACGDSLLYPAAVRTRTHRAAGATGPGLGGAADRAGGGRAAADGGGADQRRDRGPARGGSGDGEDRWRWSWRRPAPGNVRRRSSRPTSPGSPPRAESPEPPNPAFTALRAA